MLKKVCCDPTFFAASKIVKNMSFECSLKSKQFSFPYPSYPSAYPSLLSLSSFMISSPLRDFLVSFNDYIRHFSINVSRRLKKY